MLLAIGAILLVLGIVVGNLLALKHLAKYQHKAQNKSEPEDKE